MRLIDADALKAELEDIARELFDDNGHFEIHMADVLYTLEDAPTIDAVEVVRCKDCKWYEQKQKNLPYAVKKSYCNRSCTLATKEDDFCSFGERNEE